MANNGSITPRILLVEDDALMRDSLKVLLSQDYQVEAVVNQAAALAAIQQQAPNLILVDVLMSSWDGLALLQAHPPTPLQRGARGDRWLRQSDKISEIY